MVTIAAKASITRNLEQELIMKLNHDQSCKVWSFSTEDAREQHCTCGAVLAEKNKDIALLGKQLLVYVKERDQLLNALLTKIDERATALELKPTHSNNQLRDARVSVETLRYVATLVTKVVMNSHSDEISVRSAELAATFTADTNNGYIEKLANYCAEIVIDEGRQDQVKHRAIRALQYTVHGTANPLEGSEGE